MFGQIKQLWNWGDKQLDKVAGKATVVYVNNRIDKVVDPCVKAVGNCFDIFTGKRLEQKVTEYSEVYGTVLLGMQQDIEEYRKDIRSYSTDMEAKIAEARKIALDLQAQTQAIRRLVWLNRLSFFLAFIALGIALWK